MVRKEDLCDWFKALPAHKRVDYLCGLLHMCHPLELRFTGTVLEDLAKKDFHYLRDQEIKANQRADLSSKNSTSLNDHKLRGKIITALALMNSTNFSCAEIIFDILQQHFDNMLGLLRNSINAADLILILTMAVHHPAFTFYQKNRLGEVLERVEGHLRELYGDDDDERDLILQSQTLTPETTIQPGSLNSSQSPLLQPEKATVTAIEIIDAQLPTNQKGGAQYRIHTTWSNGEVTEVVLKFKQLQELHHKILHKFPEEKKKHMSVPVFPGKYTHKEESLSDQIISLNGYFRQLAKAPIHILDCDILTEPLRSGTLVYQPKPISIHTAPTASVSQSRPQAMFIQASPLREDRKYDLSQYHQPIMMPYSAMVPHSHCSPGASQMSSTANSPVNSRASSPAPPVPNPGGKSNYLPPGTIRGGGVTVSGIGMLQAALNADQISQLLHVLNLDEYYENLKDYPFQQIMNMSKEDFAKAGLSADAQVKLKSKLDHVKSDYTNPMDPSRFPSATTSPAFYPPFCFHPFTFITPPYPQHFIHQSYPAQPGHVTLLASPHPHIQASENSPANSETSSPPPSPLLQQVAGLSLDHGPGHIVSQVQPMPGPAVLHMMSPPAAVPADSQVPSDVKLLKSDKIHQLDSSGSEEERGTGYSQEIGSPRRKVRGRPHQSRSLPLINQGTMPASAMEATMLTGMPISLSAPHTHQSIINVEARTDSTPSPQAVSTVAAPLSAVNTAAVVVNGYISDPPPIPQQGNSGIMPRAILNSRTFKTAQPAHTSLGVHKNVTNMPALDLPHQLPSLGKNGASSNSLPIVHASLPPHSYNICPSVASVPPGHVLGLNPVSFPANNTLQLGPQPPPAPSYVQEGSGAYHMYMFSHPRGILTTIANSTPVMTTTQSHHAGPPLSHSPSPAGTTVCADQFLTAPYIVEAPPSRPEEASLTPPAQTPVHVSAVKPQTSAGGTSSGTPSPPLVPTAPNKLGTESQHGSRGPHMYGVINGALPQISFYHQGHQHPQHFPNGITSDYGGWMRLPHHISSGYIPYVYGGVIPQQNITSTLHPNPSSSGLAPATVNQSHPGGGVSGKSRYYCYNCGKLGHKASECEESRMENMSNTFHLKYKPSDPPA